LVLSEWTGSLAFGIAILRTAVIRRARKPIPLHYWMLAFAAWAALSLLWTVDRDSTIARVGTYVQLLAAVWLVWELAVTETRVRGLLLVYVLSSLVASCSALYNFLTGQTAAQIASAYGITKWDNGRFSIAGVNENDLGLMLALSIPVVFYLLVTWKGPLAKLLCWIQLVTGITAILLTASRGSAIAAMAGLLMFPLTISRLPRRQRLVSVLAFAALLVCGIFLVPQVEWTRILALGREVSEGTMTHRTLLWSAGLEAFRDHSFLGVGAGAYGASILKIVDVPYVAHNTFLSVLVELGVAGALLLLGLLTSIFYCALRMRYVERCLWITLLATWVVGVSALTWEYRKPTWLLFGLVAAHAYSRQVANRRP
jgi:O-antigen ligase